MPTSISISFAYDELTPDERGKLLNLVGRGLGIVRKHAASVVELGEIMSTARQVLANHTDGVFCQWVETEWGISRQTAYNWIAVFERFGGCPIIGQLESTVLYRLTAKNCPEPARKEVEKLAAKGKVTAKQVGEIIKKHKPAKEPPAATKEQADDSPILTIAVYENGWVEAFKAFWESCPRGPKIVISGLVGGGGDMPEIDNDLIPKELDKREFLTAWVDWCKHKGKSYSVKAQKGQLKRLAVMGAKRAVYAIEYSIAQNYKGVFEENGKSNESSKRKSGMDYGG